MQQAESAGPVNLPLTIPEMVVINKKTQMALSWKKCIALKEAIKITQEEADLVSKSTREQSKDSKWKDRIGRITASKAHDVIVKYDLDMKVRNQSAENFCSDICGYNPEVKSKLVHWGTQTEPVACQTFNKTMKKLLKL